MLNGDPWTARETGRIDGVALGLLEGTRRGEGVDGASGSVGRIVSVVGSSVVGYREIGLAGRSVVIVSGKLVGLDVTEGIDIGGIPISTLNVGIGVMGLGMASGRFVGYTTGGIGILTGAVGRLVGYPVGVGAPTTNALGRSVGYR